MSNRNANRAALASATALQGGTVSPDPTPTKSDAPVSEALPNKSDNLPGPSKRALEYAATGLTRAREGDDMVDSGRAFIAAAIVDLCIASHKWTPRDAIIMAQSNADSRDGALAKWHADMVRTFALNGGDRPGGATKAMSLIQQQVADAEMAEFKRRQYHVTVAADTALCLIASGCTMRDFNAKAGAWELLAAHYCEAPAKPNEPKRRYAMQRVHSEADKVQATVTIGTTTQPAAFRRDVSWFIDNKSREHAILYWSASKVALREGRGGTTRAPHRNASSTVSGGTTKTPAVSGATVSGSTSVAGATSTSATPATPAMGNPATPSTSSTVTSSDAPATVASAIGPVPVMSNPDRNTLSGAERAAREGWDNNVVSARRAILSMVGATAFGAEVPKAAAKMINPAVMSQDAWRAWIEIARIAQAWLQMNGAVLVDASTTPATPATPTSAPTVVDGVTLSTPVAADKTPPVENAKPATKVAAPRKTKSAGKAA